MTSWAIRGGLAVTMLAMMSLAMVMLGFCDPLSARVMPVRCDLRVETDGGYARIVLHMAENVGSEIREAGGILVIGFDRPMEIAATAIAAQAPDYVSAARRDPDGRALRVALKRKVSVHATPVGEWLFVDLLPEGWSGYPPGLPKEVIAELSQRARAAPRATAPQVADKPKETLRVRVVRHGAFSRFLFPLKDAVTVKSDRNESGLTLVFAAPLVFDLAEARAALPDNVKSLDAETASDTSTLRFIFETPVDSRSFREDGNYVVDIGSLITGGIATPAAPENPAGGEFPNDAEEAGFSDFPAASKAAPVPLFDAARFDSDRQSPFVARQDFLIAAASAAPEIQRATARLALARFYLAHEMFAEAKGVLDLAIADASLPEEKEAGLMLRAVANVMQDRAPDALRDLASPELAGRDDVALWQAVAQARQGQWRQAHDAFRQTGDVLAALPVALRRAVLADKIRAALESEALPEAAAGLARIEAAEPPAAMRPVLDLFAGRLAQARGYNKAALQHYRTAAASPDSPVAAQARLREISLQHETGQLAPDDAMAAFEALSVTWRGDQVEIETLHRLSQLYLSAQRYRDAFHTMRVALRAYPHSILTRRIHDAAAVSFNTLFLTAKGDAMSAVDALGLFYDFRDLTPLDRRGDEMIRRFAERLVSLDLLPQAADLLQHQIEHRLQGPARAQVASRLAAIHLLDGKPDKAREVLRATRMAGLPEDLRLRRLALEARALSDLGRHDAALDILETLEAPDAIRLRADIFWRMARYQEAAEQFEIALGESWKETEPLAAAACVTVLRAALGYALGHDAIGIARLRERYGSKLTEGADREAFEIATSPLGGDAGPLRAVANRIAALAPDNLLRDMGQLP